MLPPLHGFCSQTRRLDHKVCTTYRVSPAEPKGPSTFIFSTSPDIQSEYAGKPVMSPKLWNCQLVVMALGNCVFSQVKIKSLYMEAAEIVRLDMSHF